MNQKQSPSTGESTKEQDQKQQEPARSDMPARRDVPRSGAEPSRQPDGNKGPKSGGMGPKQ